MNRHTWIQTLQQLRGLAVTIHGERAEVAVGVEVAFIDPDAVVASALGEVRCQSPADMEATIRAHVQGLRAYRRQKKTC